MPSRIRLAVSTVLMAFLLPLAVASSAWAHHPVIVSLTAECRADGFYVTYRVGAWEGFVDGTGRGNPQVDVYFDGVLVDDTGEFTAANSYQFVGTKKTTAGPGDQVVVRAVAVAAWSSGATGGQDASASIILPAERCGTTPGTGRFTGGGNQVDVGGVAKVTRGLTIHCDLKLSNNLEINWNGGQNFHMTSHTSAVCSDDPLVEQRPPAAPLDTMVGKGTGRYNNTSGYTIEFTLVDAGEPGRSDSMAMKIYETANPVNVVLNVPLTFLSGGNLQAHYDQPHK